MSTETAIVRAAQLVYTNVEAEDSPTRRRGFQVWLFTPGLSEGLRRELAKRLGDFHPPTPTRPTDPKPEAVARHVYFDAVNDGKPVWVLAQTVPLAERDKFGRGGRFYAHALILSEEEFARVYFNPFTILDGGFRFDAAIDQGKQLPDWRKGIAPEIGLEIRARHGPPEGAGLPAELVTYLQKDDYTPIALAEPPDVVLVCLRSIFGRLPAQLRARASFDTLSTGQSLNTVPFRFAGAFAPETLRRWHYRKANRWDRATGKFTPPLAGESSPAAQLLSRWAAAGAPASDTELRAAYDLLAGIASGDCTRCRADGLGEARLLEIVSYDAVTEALPRLEQHRCATDLADEGLRARVAPFLESYFQTPYPSLVLQRLAAPIPPQQLAEWLLANLTADPVPQMPVDEAQRLSAWLGDRAGDAVERCRWIARRWEGRFDEVTAICNSPGQDERTAWFRDWCRRSFHAVFGGTDLPQRVRDQLNVAQPGERLLSEAEFYLRVSDSLTKKPAREPSEPPRLVSAEGAEPVERDSIRFLLAFHHGDGQRMIELLGTPHGNDLYDLTLRHFEEAETRAEFRCYLNESAFYLGVEAVFVGRGAEAIAALAHACFQVMPEKTTRFWLRRATADLPEPFTGWRVQPVHVPRERAELPHLVAKERWETLTDRLRGATDSNYQDFAETVIQPCRSAPVAARPSAKALWFGVRIGWLDPNSARTQNGMLGSVLQSVLPVTETDRWENLDAHPPEGPVDRFRVRWLLECLLRPEMIGKLVINRG
jgi:hypothetical protein